MVPVPLVATVGVGGITETAVTARESLIVDREDANATKLLQRDTHSSEILNNWFKKFQTVFRTSAPLLLASMERDCTQAAPYAVFHDGMRAWEHITTLGQPAAMRCPVRTSFTTRHLSCLNIIRIFAMHFSYE